MALAPDARLGPYQIVAPLGAGGMGEVYRARDTRLNRDIALKTLPPGLWSDPDRRARFEQEARAASALSHPNIITVLDVGEEAGVAWIAMELVEGRTLRELLAAGPLTTRRTLEVAAQVADGLAKAHGAGILHRDLKPDNVMVSKDGYVKLLDFGLAKLVVPDAEPPSEEPTLLKPLTHAGVVMGTVGYMSPEQAAGKPTDFRSDQFSLGAILFEMATGARPFERPTAAETLAAIIREEPEPIARLNPRTPAPLRWITERCLAKDPDDRFASTRDLARDLASLRDHLSETTMSGQTAPAPPARTRRHWRFAAALAAAALAVGFGLGALALRRAGSALGETEFDRLTFRRGTVLSARFAPDGQSVVYTAAWEGGAPEVYSVRFDSPESRSLGLPAADLLSVSGSGELALGLGRRFGFGWERVGTLARAPLGGGAAPREVLENVMDADWAPDGQGLAVVRDAGEKRRLEFPPGKLLHETSGWISSVRVSPSGERVAFLDHPSRGDNVGAVVVADLAGSLKTLAPRAANGLAWSPDGREVFTGGGLAFDLAGRSRRVLPGPIISRLHDVSRDGRLLFTRGSGRREIVGRAPGGARERNLSWLSWSFPYDLSDDGTTLLFGEQDVYTDGQYTLYLRPTDGSPAVKLGAGTGMALSPDGKWALATTARPGEDALVVLPTGAGEPRTIVSGSTRYEAGSWFPDGQHVLVCAAEAGRASRLYVVDVASGESRAVSPEGVSAFAWREVSPDGRTALALAADGTPTLYPIDGGEPRPLPGATREDVPIRWAADGRSIYVQRGSEAPPRVDRIEVATGARQLWRELSLPDPAGVMTVGPILLSADGESYVYSYRRATDDLMVATGVR